MAKALTAPRLDEPTPPEHLSVQLAAAPLIPEINRRWLNSFLVMMVLSVVIATLGLSLDSVAVVIGGMLVAPMMVPVLGMAGALVAGRMGPAGVMLALITGAAVVAVCVASCW